MNLTQTKKDKIFCPKLDLVSKREENLFKKMFVYFILIFECND